MNIFSKNTTIKNHKPIVKFLKRRFGRSFLDYSLLLIFIFLSVPFLFIIRIIRPLYLIRFGGLWNQHIGHYAMCTELFLCKKDIENTSTKSNHIIDIFYLRSKTCSNNYLTIMWKRQLKIMPSLPIKALAITNKIIPGGSFHDIGLPAFDRDIDSLLEVTSIHLKFTDNEKRFGEQQLRAMGIKNNSPFICLLVRDDAYYDSTFSFTNYRNANVNNYLLAAESLTKMGYYIIRMGVKVNTEIKSSNSMIIDYANNGMRNEFMDIYLASKCAFCITTGSGWDNLPNIFRKPVVYTNLMPIADFPSSSHRFLNITKSFISKIDGHELTLKEIISKGLLYSKNSCDYEKNDIELRENTPEEINDVAIEMHKRISNTYIFDNLDEDFQLKFWKYIVDNNPKDKSGMVLHKNPIGRVGSDFLKNKSWWLN